MAVQGPFGSDNILGGSLLPQGDFMPTGSSNQYFPMMPSLPQQAPGIVPQAQSNILPSGASNPFSTSIGGGFRAFSPLDPALTNALSQFLGQNVGQGATPFNLATLLPSGGTTQPGTLTAPLNPIMQALQQFYQTGQGGPPGASSLQQISQTGIPTDVGPEFKSIVDAMQRQISQGQANLREQFAFAGNLASSPFGQASTDYQAQTAKDLNQILATLHTQASEAAAGRRLTASDILTKSSTDFAQQLQGLDQQAIQSLLVEFIRTRPEYGPLLNMIFGLSTTFPTVASSKFGIGAFGALAQGAGSAAQGAAALIKAIRDRGGASPTPTGGTPPFLDPTLSSGI